MSSQTIGRHRAPSPFSSASFSSAMSRSVQPASKASAVIVISGAMVASLALPASAAVSVVKAPETASVALAFVTATPAAAQAPLAPRTFGQIGFTGVVKPAVVVAPVVRPVVAVSRSTTRAAISSVSSSAPQTSAVAPVSQPGAVGIAASLAGIYYIYGGSTPAGFDCSGLTRYVFGKLGINLPRTAEEQRQAVTSVSTPRPGDLVFFGSPAYHVGIYAGNGMMWDSPHTGSAVALRAVWSSTPTYGRP